MTQESVLDPESSAVRTHLNIMQGVIQRMAENSRACKFWCVTIASATLVLVARTERPEYALIPSALFFILDAYYLALERRFRSSYSTFLNEKTVVIDAAIAGTSRLIDLVQQYRASLIHHVVTGKRDVR